MVRCVKTIYAQAQKVKKDLLKADAIDQRYQVAKDKTHIYFPVVDDFKPAEYNIVNKNVKKSIRQEKTVTAFKDVLGKILSSAELAIAKTAYEHIGTIAIIEIPDELQHREQEIAQALLESNNLICTVLKKQGGHEGVFRAQQMKYLAGKDTRVTSYKENNCILHVDVQEVYYSSRLATERKRIAQLVSPGEDILVMFSGAAPYPCVLAKNTKAHHITGIEINPEGHRYGLKNCKANKLSNVTLHCGDVRTIAPQLSQQFDRILMPLPKTAETFLDTALTLAKDNATIHLYGFYHEDEFGKAIEHIKEHTHKANMSYEIIGVHKVGQQSPRTYRICVDFRVQHLVRR